MAKLKKLEPQRIPTWKPEEEGAELKGILVDKEANVGPNNSKLYSIQQSDGDVIKVWGSASLDSLLGQVETDSQLVIKYLGRKTNVSTGRKYKAFEAFVIED